MDIRNFFKNNHTRVIDKIIIEFISKFPVDFEVVFVSLHTVLYCCIGHYALAQLIMLLLDVVGQ